MIWSTLVLTLGLANMDAQAHWGPPGEPAILSVAGDPHHQRCLKEKGFGCDGMGQLTYAFKHGDERVRISALSLMAYQMRMEAIPQLRKGLDDQLISVRVEAARFLGILGDRTCIDLIRKDFAFLTSGDGNTDPDVISFRGLRKRRQATDLARALSEVGDASGYELAARMALEGEDKNWRIQAVTILANLCLTGESVQSKHAIDSEKRLLDVADCETDATVLRILQNQADKLPDSSAKRIYERLVDSPHFPYRNKKNVNSILSSTR